MHAVVRETTYSAGTRIEETDAFQRFQDAHASLAGYSGTVVVDAGNGRFYTLTLWESAEAMTAAREAIGPMVERALEPLMVEPSRLLGTGPVVVNDLASREEGASSGPAR